MRWLTLVKASERTGILPREDWLCPIRKWKVAEWSWERQRPAWLKIGILPTGKEVGHEMSPVVWLLSHFSLLLQHINLFFFKENFFLIYLFIETEREREREREAEEETGSMQGAWRGTGSRVSRITPRAAGSTKPLSHRGCPQHYQSIQS